MLDDLTPDGIRIVVTWSSMVVGASVFIPCLNTYKAKEQVKKIATTKKWQVTTKITIENNRLGIRIWRMV